MNAPSLFVKKKRRPWNEHSEIEGKQRNWKQKRTAKGEAKRIVECTEKDYWCRKGVEVSQGKD